MKFVCVVDDSSKCAEIILKISPFIILLSIVAVDKSFVTEGIVLPSYNIAVFSAV